MLISIISVLVPTLVYAATPKILKAGKKWRWLLFIACVLMFASWYLPSPLINGKSTQFVTHLVGGGIFSGVLWLYIKLVKQWRKSWWIEAASLFALVCTLGVANELFEWVLFEAGHMPQGITDTTYDLVANTLGALLVFLAYISVRLVRKYGTSRH